MSYSPGIDRWEICVLATICQQQNKTGTENRSIYKYSHAFWQLSIISRIPNNIREYIKSIEL